MKTSLTASIIFVLFMAFVVYMCSREERIEGKYSVSVVFNVPVDSNTSAALAATQIQYEFLDNGSLNIVTIVGSDVKTDVQQWSIHGDSIYINAQHYKLESLNDGHVLTNSAVNLILKKQS